MKKAFLFLTLITAMTTAASMAADNTIPYKVIYKWGFIEKVAGHGIVKTHSSGDTLTASLSGHSIPWAGRIYSVNDSLVATLTSHPKHGDISETVIYENGIYTKPLVGESANNTAFKNISGDGTLDASPETMEAITITADMLGLYGLAGKIDFDGMETGQTTVVNIGGNKPGKLELTYVDRTECLTPSGGIPSWHVFFDYAYEGKMSGYKVECWIGVDEGYPVMIAADLPLGHMEMVVDR